jgi:hypothetical protein
MILDLIKTVASPILGLIDKSVEDKDQAAKLKAQINEQLLNIDTKALESQAKIITAEAQGGSFIQQNWRPITMLTFVGLIAAHWLGFTPENLSEAQVLGLLDIVQVGLGGYIVGRSGEKIMKEYKKPS